MVDSLFDSSRLLITAAQEEFDKLVVAEKAFTNDPETCTLVREFNLETGDKLIKLRLQKPVPKSIRLNIYRLVTDLRNALDQGLFAAWTAFSGAEPDEDTYFPIGGSETDFRAKVRRRVPEPLWDTFDAFEAHPSGNKTFTEKDLLFALSKISGPNKHRIVIGVGINPNQMLIKEATAENTLIHFPRWDRGKNEVTLFTIKPGGKIDYNIFLPLFISFEKVRMVDGQPVRLFAQLWIARVAEVVEAIARESVAKFG